MLEAGKTPEDILNTIFDDAVIHEKTEPKFSCNCSTEKTKKALLNVGTDELKAILKEDKGANIHCHFCNKDYYFGEDVIREMLR